MDHDTVTDAEEFLHGSCHLLALALHRLTGLKIGAYLDVDPCVPQTVLVHAFVVDGDHCIDIRGRLPADDVIAREFDTVDPWLVTMNEAELLELGEGSPQLDAHSERYQKALCVAGALATQLQLPQIPELAAHPGL